MRRASALVTLCSVALLAVFVTGSAPSALAQPAAQPPAGQPAQPPAGQPAQPRAQQPGQPGQPGAQPVRPGQPGQPGAQPGRPGQPGQPGAQPRPPRRQPPNPNLPPGHPPLPGQKPAAPPPAPAKSESHAAHDCHGPNSPAHHVNWYQGLLGVDNTKALSPRLADRVLYRYYNDKDECDPRNMEAPFLASILNLALLLGVLVVAGRKPLIEGLARRKKTIMADIDAANELFTLAEKRLKSYQKQLSRIESRRAELQDEYRSQWETERKRILAETEEKTVRMRKDAEFRVSQELKQAEADLLREAVEGAVAAAQELVAKRIQNADQERLADEYLIGIAAALAAGSAAPRGRDQRRTS